MEMDFHTLSRRELQALCKKNKIPANMTNLAMADALAALQQVDGLEEFLNAPETDTVQWMGKDSCGTPGVARTATRMSARRKPTKEQQELESSVLSTRSRRSTRKVHNEMAVQECGGTNLLETPAAPATRRKVHAASVRGKVEIVGQEAEKDEVNKNVPEDDSVMESRQKKTLEQVYSRRRSVRLLEKTMADLTLADKTTLEPIKMNKLDMETAAKKVKEVEEINDADEVNAQTVLAHGWEIIDYDASSVQSRSDVPENETEVGDGKEENAEIDNSAMSTGVEPALSGSDVKDNGRDTDQLVYNIIETAMDLEDGYVAKMGDNSAIEVLEEKVSFKTEYQLLAPYHTSAAEILESAPEVENQLGVHSSTSAIEDSEERSPSEGSLARQNLDEIFSKPQEGTDETISQDVLEVPSLPEDQVDSSQQLESGRKYASSEPPIHSIYNLDQLAPECNAASSISISAGLMSVDKMGSEVSAAGKSRMQVSQFAEKENIITDEPGLTEIPFQIVECAYEAPISIPLTEEENFAVTDPELILPRAKTPENIQLCAYSEASTDGFIMPQVEFAGETDGLPQSLAKAPTSANRADAFSPRMAGKSSGKKQNPLKKMENILDENKENINSNILRAEPNIEKAKKINTNVDEDSMLTPLNDKSLRQLNKMLKEKLQIANRKSNDISMQEHSGKIRQALQALPGNSMAVVKTGEN